MSREHTDARSDVVALWLSCLVVLFAATSFTWFRIASAIDDERARATRDAAFLRDDSARFARRVILDDTVRRQALALQAFDLGADRPLVVARFVREAARVAALDGTRVVQIDQRPIEPAAAASASRGVAIDGSAPAGGAPPDAALFETLPLDITLHGSYRDIVRTIRDLAAAPLAVRIEPLALERANNDDRTGAALVARFAVGLDRLREPADAPSGARKPPDASEDAHAGSF